MKRLLICSAVVVGVLSTAVSAQAQRRGRGPAAGPGGVAPAEVQQMFDAYALLQAQEQLKLDDEHYARFLPRFKALQDARRKAMQDRVRILQDLRQVLNQPQPDEAPLRDRLKALRDLDSRSAADIRKAHDALDQVLDVRQQAAFRVFEETMERRKVELVTRARQANRPRNQQ